MAGYVVVGMLASFGALCALWALYGLFVPGSKGTLLILDNNDQDLLRRCLWLREMGLLRCSLATPSEDLDGLVRMELECHRIEIWDASLLAEQFGTGAKEHGTGTGDSPGCHQCGGISEL